MSQNILKMIVGVNWICLYLTFAYIAHIDREKYLVFVELKNIGQIKQIVGKFYLKKELPFYGERAQILQTFS